MATMFTVKLEDLLKVKIDAEGTVKAVADNIINHELAGRASMDNFTTLARIVVDANVEDKEGMQVVLQPGEDEVLKARGSCGEKVRTNSGKLMRSKVCSNSTYSSNKSVIGNCLEQGVEITTGEYNEHGDAIIRGKSELEKELKEKKAPKSAFDIANQGITMAINQFGNLTPEQIRTLMDTLYNSATEHGAITATAA